MESRYQPIEHYGIIGNLRTAALVGMEAGLFPQAEIFGHAIVETAHEETSW